MNDTKMHKKSLRMAKKIVIASRNTSTSYLQRKMKISYNDAAKLMGEISKLSGFRFLHKARKKASLD
ncbi:MAG: hypothetical protein L0Y61_08665 [Epsilonproteobacteria bacterium]|nr:hypothetical protein [Campylobacterota bacterium]